MTLWTVACQAPLSMGFSRQEYWSGLPCPPPGDRMTVIAYIIDLRLRIASTMLSDTDLPIAEIAERTGCGDISYFERIFKKKYTESPTSYRNQRRIK